MWLNLDELPEQEYDVVVVGAGGAGMSSALCAAIGGARVLLVERTEYVGGTTALSGGTTWIPGTRHSAQVNDVDTLQTAEAYLTRAVGDRTPASMRHALLAAGPEAVDYVESNSEVKFAPYPIHPDYITELEGSTMRGRALEPVPFDGRRLGKLMNLVRPPIPEFTVLGGMAVDRNDIFHLLRATQTAKSFLYCARIIARHWRDRLVHGAGTRMVMGRALVGRLLLSLEQKGVTILTQTSVVKIDGGADGVTAVTLAAGGTRRSVRVRGGLVLASGGFTRHPELRKTMLPGVDIAWCPGAPGHTGQAHDLARSLGARYGDKALSPSFWAPVSIRKRPDGSTAVWPHFVMDRAKPGMITVNKAGRRFLNESTSYHLFGIGMQEANRQVPSVPAYLVCDAEALRKYGIGMVRPRERRLAPYLADGYLTCGDTLEQLAQTLGIDAAGLKDSVARINAYSETGVDPDFQRGGTAYQRYNGDATWTGKNPNIGPLAKPPYYAVRLYPGDIGAATGFVTDEHSRVLDGTGQAIAGLYAVGADAHSVMGGVYTAPGITIGPGLVFGYLAARDATKRAQGVAPNATRSTAAETPQRVTA
ncbi:MAG: FAD-dependent oxidoreductase [Dokdonella sp.]|nr:FAD-dependent oxidoreductase [Dokdonella sp.]